MALKKVKPVTPGQRHIVKEDFSILTKKEPEKSLIVRLPKRAGRSKTTGRITTRHKGGGARKLYRIIEFGQRKLGIKAKVLAIEYDPNRTAFIALIQYEDGDKAYIIAPQNLKVGDEVVCDEKAEIKEGNRMKLEHIPVGTLVYNVEIVPGGKGKMVRAAGTSAKVVAHEGDYVHLQMPSGEVRKIHKNCFASIGAISRPDWRYTVIGKAGRVRKKGIRPTVRGSAMSAVAHPHGGGEGKTGIGYKYPRTPWGKPARGVKTRKRKNTDQFIVISRHDLKNKNKA
ncbi:50S ribosomal protein L2 [bacterium HR34]|nr:50S ribosomal protein L2 [bacterium HR34]